LEGHGFLQWTPDNHLRHSSFIALREDRDVRELRREAIAGDAQREPCGTAAACGRETDRHRGEAEGRSGGCD
jgi:hypothetical protein